jgi:hypothetical protein
MDDATYTRLTFRRGKSKDAREYPGSVPAITRTPIKRYNCGMTVGSGWYRHYSHTDAIGSLCAVAGWFSDGRVSVALPVGGFGILGRADVEITSWPDYVTAEQRAEWEALPAISRVVDGEMIQ